MIVWLAGCAWDDVPGTERRLVSRLGTLIDVMWVDPPRAATQEIRARFSGGLPMRARIENVAPGILRLRTVGPPGVTRPAISTIARAQVNWAIRTRLARTGTAVTGVVVASPLATFPRIGAGRKLYYVTDDFVAGADLMGLSTASVRRIQMKNLAAADLILVVSPTLADMLSRPAQRVEILANGCEPDHYAQVETLTAPEEVKLPRPIAGVVGQINERLDIGVLEAIAERGISLLFVGPRCERTFQMAHRLDALVQRPNVQWVGEKSFDSLRSYLAAIDVGLTPYADTQFNRASCPLKTVEYLAAGRPVVATDLPSARWLRTDLIDIATNPTEFVDLVSLRLSDQQDSSRMVARRQFAQDHSWTRRAQALLDFVSESIGLPG